MGRAAFTSRPASSTMPRSLTKMSTALVTCRLGPVERLVGADHLAVVRSAHAPAGDGQEHLMRHGGDGQGRLHLAAGLEHDAEILDEDVDRAGHVPSWAG